MPPERERLLHETPFSILTLDGHRESGVIHGWDNDRLMALCGKLSKTPYELGRMCCIFNAPNLGKLPSHALLESCMAKNHFPPMAALHFSLLEQWHKEKEHRHD